jgi:glycosyltransferase involved in cell wall biosynthesis
MKIAMIGQKGIPAHAGGIERHVEELSKMLVSQGHEVMVFCRGWYAKAQDNYHGIRCIETSCIKTKHLDAITHTFTSILRAAREQVDVFHIHGVGPALLAWLPKILRPSAKVIVTFHCVDRHHQKWNALARLMLRLGEWMACRMPDATIVVSKTLQTYCQKQYNTRAIYIPNGAHIPLEDANPVYLKDYGLKPDEYLLMCSRLVRHKGAHTLIKAWKLLRKQSPTLAGQKKLAIVGGSAFTEDYIRELHTLAQNDDSIVLTGTQTGPVLHALFRFSYAMVHPSESEGLPIAVLEAMGYGKCVLSSDIPENRELTDEVGLTFKTNNVEDLAEHLKMLLEHPDLVKAVGAEARTYVASRYDWKDIAQKTAYLYEISCVEPLVEKQVPSS